MAPNAKRVFYVKYLSGPVFGQILAKRPDIQLDKLENETPTQRPSRSCRRHTRIRSARRAR